VHLSQKHLSGKWRRKNSIGYTLIIHDATLSSQRWVIFIEHVVCRDVNYVKCKLLTFAYPNEKLTSYILERWPKKYVCVFVCEYMRVRMRTKTEVQRACHNPAWLRFFSPFDVLRDLRISARHSPRWILYYLLRSCTDTWTIDVPIVSLIRY